MVVYGKHSLLKSGDLELKSDYEDDTAVFYGKNRIYLKRHVVRAYNEAQELLLPHMKRGLTGAAADRQSQSGGNAGG